MSGKYANLLRPLTEQEYTTLKASLTAWGYTGNPILVDESGETIDGHHRARACGELGIEPRREVVKGSGDKRLLAYALNDGRRHLTPEERARLHQALHAEGKSQREIAKTTGAARNTVAKDVAQSEPPGRVTGADGKSYPAKQSSVPAVSSTKPPNGDGEPKDPPVVTDEVVEIDGGQVAHVAQSEPPGRVTGVDGKSYSAKRSYIPRCPTCGQPMKMRRKYHAE